MAKSDSADQPTGAVEQPADLGRSRRSWWPWVVVIALIVLVAAVAYLIISSRDDANKTSTDEDTIDSTTQLGPDDPVEVNIENFHQLTPRSQVALIDDLVAAIEQNGDADHSLYYKLIVAYANNGQYDLAFATYKQFEAVAAEEEKSFGFYADGARWALAAGDEQAARYYYDLAVNYDPDNQDPDYLTDVNFFKDEMKDLFDE